MRSRVAVRIGLETLAVVIATAVFGIPFIFALFTAGKGVAEASVMHFAPPIHSMYLENFRDVLEAGNGLVVVAFWNSAKLTVFSLAVLVLVSAMGGFILERRGGRAIPVATVIIMAGLMIPPSVVTTIWVLQRIHLYRTMTGMVLIETALAFPFAVLLYRAHMVTIPREIDEASIIDGCSGMMLFSRVIFPLMQPVTATIVVLSGINVFNDFVNPLYFFPGAGNATIQLTLYNFMSLFVTQWNLLFANVLLISIPPLLLFIVFNRRIVAGIVAGAVKY